MIIVSVFVYNPGFLGTFHFFVAFLSCPFLLKEDQKTKDMLAVSQQISSVGQVVNALSRELFELKKQVASAPTSGAPPMIPNNEDMQRAISAGVTDCHARITEVKKLIELTKAEMTKDISIMETAMSRKIEANVNKMLNDKIAVALESYKNSIKDMIVTELQSDQDTINREPEDDFEINVTLSPSAVATPATPKARGGRSKKAVPVGVDKDA